jgi:hypothetical protein
MPYSNQATDKNGGEFKRPENAAKKGGEFKGPQIAAKCSI